MELKLAPLRSPLICRGFQSYLYGIEIKLTIREVSLRRVSIVPLWNWNIYDRIYYYFVFARFNRTFMELKSLTHKPSFACIKVSIVPLWNWNTHSPASLMAVSKVSIVPLWNWNTEWRIAWLRVAVFQSYLYGIEINTTSAMILKRMVSIVPLWNWNSDFKFAYTTVNGFNRTFMELKLQSLYDKATTAISFNRTFMELKYKCCQEPCFRWTVSIVPLWNWNVGLNEVT